LDRRQRTTAFGLTNDGSGGKASISSCFYLLVKYAEVTPKSFVCKGDSGTSEFKLADITANLGSGFELIDAWDFGPGGTGAPLGRAAATRIICRLGRTTP